MAIRGTVIDLCCKINSVCCCVLSVIAKKLKLAVLQLAKQLYI
jgi:hypothetical protein